MLVMHQQSVAAITTAELERRLLEEGCNPANFSINTRSYDGFCLLNDGLRWAVFYSERGRDQEPIFTSIDEATACQFYLDFTLNMRHYHLVGMLRSEPVARALQVRLGEQGMATHTDKLLYARNDYRHRIMAVGKDIFKAWALLGQLPVQDVNDAHPGFWERLRLYLS
jgi:hypothetical protein